jgi:hypothetical protein
MDKIEEIEIRIKEINKETDTIWKDIQLSQKKADKLYDE